VTISVDLAEGVADWWMLGATLGAALATAASAVVVAVQAVQTSRSTKAAVRAAEASERNADAAVRAAEVSERMLAMSEQARREAAVPNVILDTPQLSEERVYRRPWLDPTQWELLQDGFSLPFDGPEAYPVYWDEVGLRFPVTLHNDGQAGAFLTVEGAAFVEEGPLQANRDTWVIRPGETLRGHIIFFRDVGAWAGYTLHRDALEPAGVATISCGVGTQRRGWQMWRLTAAGDPFMRDPHNENNLVLGITGTQLYRTMEDLGTTLEEPPT
jgi:hypothetical protein